MPSIITRLSPSIVVVSTAVDGNKRRIGTGFAVRANGYYITAYHLTLGESLRIGTVNKGIYRSFEAEVVGFDKQSDIALIKSPLQLRPLTLNANERKAGEAVAATGFPFGPTIDGVTVHTTLTGIISCIRPAPRQKADVQSAPDDSPVDKISAEVSIKQHERFQLDMAVEDGISGAPVYLSSSGEVVGMITSNLVPNDINIPRVSVGFATSTKSIRELLKKFPSQESNSKKNKK